jgi:precorrin-6Y C5,15-methyltransferase (decarboxylating)
MTRIHVIGVGLDGRAGLSQASLQLVDQATVLMGYSRHLSYFPDSTAEVWPLEDLKAGLERLARWLATSTSGFAVVLASGDPLLFGLGRLLLASLPPASLTFHPHLSSVQLAFNRLKLPWQTATLVSVHGRSAEALIPPLRRGEPLLAVLTDPTHTPAHLAGMLLSLNLPYPYRLHVCENLGSPQEAIHTLSAEAAVDQTFAPLNVVVLQRLPPQPSPSDLPLLGLPDTAFATFVDRPGLITKRDIRLQVLGDLALQPGQVVWDIGAGTGAVSIEINRLCADTQVYAIEKTAAGIQLIETNRERLGNTHLHPIHGVAPGALGPLPNPDRVFIGGSGGELIPILQACAQRLQVNGRVVLALATLEHCSQVMAWIQQQHGEAQPWQAQYRQVQVYHSAQVGPLTRWQPLTPITLITLMRA